MLLLELKSITNTPLYKGRFFGKCRLSSTISYTTKQNPQLTKTQKVGYGHWVIQQSQTDQLSQFPLLITLVLWALGTGSTDLQLLNHHPMITL